LDKEIKQDDRRQELLERNRAAACRSRQRRKVQVQTIQDQNAKLLAANKSLAQVRET
jgi:hypothetical protein